MAVFVLVHGAWHGGWCWRRVTPLLRAAGHEVYTPTLTGLGERAHLLSPDVDLQTHVQDVVGVLTFEELHNVILVGHSYGGMVITAVAEQIPERLVHLVYLDAFVPWEGQSMLALFPEDAQAETLARVKAEGEGWHLPPLPEAEPFGVTDPNDAAWVRGKLTTHPIKTWQQPVPRTNPAAANLSCAFINCTETNWFSEFAARARQEPGWTYHEINTGHDAMISAPQDTADLLLKIVS